MKIIILSRFNISFVDTRNIPTSGDCAEKYCLKVHHMHNAVGAHN